MEAIPKSYDIFLEYAYYRTDSGFDGRIANGKGISIGSQFNIGAIQQKVSVQLRRNN